MSTLKIETLSVGPIQTNCYIIWVEGQGGCWVIDPGGLARSILRKIESLKLTPNRLIITHGHWDHFIGNRGLKSQFPELQIMIHQDDAGALPNAESNMSLSFFGKSILSPPADAILHSDDILSLNDLDFQVIHTPGHSPGSICLYCAEAKAVFSGDLIFAGGGVGRTDLPKSSPQQLRQSIVKIFDLLPDDVVVYPGHGPATTIGNERKYF